MSRYRMVIRGRGLTTVAAWGALAWALCGAGAARAAFLSATVGGSAKPAPLACSQFGGTNEAGCAGTTSHKIGDIFDVRLTLGNTSQDSNSLAPIDVTVLDGTVILSCTSPACLAAQQLSGILKFLPRNANGCEQSDPCVSFCTDTRRSGGRYWSVRML